MKTRACVLLLLALLTPLFARADAVFAFTDLDNYVKQADEIFIGECLPIDETKVSGFVFVRKMCVVSVLQGTFNPSNEVTVLAPMGLPAPLPGHYYLICGKENTRGEIVSFAFEGLSIFELPVWDQTKSQREYKLQEVLKDLKGKTLKEKLIILIRKRQDDLKREQQNIQREMDELDKVLKTAG
ncbi:MAG TPA: hypothetical protein VFY06_02335 [Verrucomicrobiae bacterium]|nr:hypothetical protein [Verrucomicrobiae bacterium]